MQKGIIFLLTLLFFSFSVYASCDSNQVDLNSASISELEELSGIGPAKAQAIIDSRPFDSVDDLIDVYGIGEVTLEKIKDQGLACIDSQEDEEENDESEENEDSEKDEDIEEDYVKVNTVYIVENKTDEKIERETIILQPQDIKTDINKDDKGYYPIIGLILFCFLLGVLYFISGRRYKKNEFKE